MKMISGHIHGYTYGDASVGILAASVEDPASLKVSVENSTFLLTALARYALTACATVILGRGLGRRGSETSVLDAGGRGSAGLGVDGAAESARRQARSFENLQPVE